jgi:hypothetical protein
MKKGFLILAVLAVLVLRGTTIWAADFSLSAGGGVLLGGHFTRYTLSGPSTLGVNIVQTQNITQFNYGGFLFFDATYGEFSVSIQNGVNTYKEKMDLESDDPGLNTGKGWETMLGLSILGKYPFTLKKTFILFPLLGIEYQISLVQQRTLSGDGRRYDRTDGLYEKNKDDNALSLSDWNSFLIKVGIGSDFILKPNLFVRGEFLYSFRLMTDYERDGLAQMKGTVPNPKLSGLSSGPNLRISVGWRFFTKEKT